MSRGRVPSIWKFGAPERSRTPNPQIRSLVLYPIELRARAEQRSRLCGLQIATPAGRGKQGGSKGRSESVLHSDIPTRESQPNLMDVQTTGISYSRFAADAASRNIQFNPWFSRP